MGKNKPTKIMGVLGGMGAAASADFYMQSVTIAQREFHAEQDSDFPAMFIYNMPITGFDETGFVNEDGVKSQLIAGVKKLESIGVDFIVIPCNTVHYFCPQMQAAICIPILSILEVTAAAVKKNGYAKVGLLNSASTKQYMLYETALSRHGITALSATADEQLLVNKVIGNVIIGVQGPEDIGQLQVIIERYQAEGAEAVILGCTELPLAISQKDCSMPLLNTTVLLAEAGLRYAYQSP